MCHVSLGFLSVSLIDDSDIITGSFYLKDFLSQGRGCVMGIFVDRFNIDCLLEMFRVAAGGKRWFHLGVRNIL